MVWYFMFVFGLDVGDGLLLYWYVGISLAYG